MNGRVGPGQASNHDLSPFAPITAVRREPTLKDHRFDPLSAGMLAQDCGRHAIDDTGLPDLGDAFANSQSSDPISC